MKSLSEIIFDVISAVEETQLNASPDMILDCSVRIFNSQNIEQTKFNGFKKTFTQTPKEIKPISVPQTNLLKKLGYKGELNIDSKQASELISKIIGKIK
jgi:hypothetical protein